MKRKLAMMVLMSSIMTVNMSGIKMGNYVVDHEKTDVVYAENEEQQESFAETKSKKKKQIKLLDELNAAKKKTRTSKKLDVDIQVGQHGNYPIRRNAFVDKKNKVIHMVDTVYDTVNGPYTYMELWIDTENNYKYKYDKTRKQYILNINDDGSDDLSYLENDYYLEKTKADFIDKESNYIKKKGKNIIKANGKKIKCKKIVLHSEYIMKSSFPMDSSIKSDLVKEPSDKVETMEIDMIYYIGLKDGKIYMIKHKTKKGDNPSGTSVIKYRYPKNNLSIPKKFTKNATLVDGIRFKQKGVIYETEYVGDKTVLFVYSTSKKIRNKKELVIPKTIKVANKEYKIRRIDELAYAEMKKLKKVVIDADVKRIGAAAFNDSYKLKTVIIKTKKLKRIDNFAFVGENITFKVPKSKIKAYKKLLKKAGIEEFTIEALDVE